MDKILLIDFHNAIWRANVIFGPKMLHEVCYAQGCEHTKILELSHCKCGSPWNQEHTYCYGDRYYIVFNFFRNLRPIIQDFAPDKCFVVDEGHPQFRYDLYADYKANRLIKLASRAEAQDRVFAAKDVILSLLPHLPLTSAHADKYEADDTIATLCDNLKAEDLTVISSDTDYIQLLQRGYNIRIYNPIKKKDMQAPDYPYVGWKCLAGDKSDNIPKLLTPAKAAATINNPDKLKKFLEVEENRANFNINRQLIEFRAVPEEEIIIQEGQRNFQYLHDAFSQMKFATLVRQDTWGRYIKTFDCLKY